MISIVGQGAKSISNRFDDCITVEIDVSDILRSLVDDTLGNVSYLQIPRTSSVADLIGWLGLPSYRVGLVTVNCEIAGSDRILQSGDEVKIFPIMGGG